MNAGFPFTNDFEKSSVPNEDCVVNVEEVVPEEEPEPFDPVAAFEPAVFFSAFNCASSSARFLFVFDLVYNGINTPSDNNENRILPAWHIVLNLLSLTVPSSSEDFRDVCFAQFQNFWNGFASARKDILFQGV